MPIENKYCRLRGWVQKLLKVMFRMTSVLIIGVWQVILTVTTPFYPIRNFKSRDSRTTPSTFSSIRHRHFQVHIYCTSHVNPIFPSYLPICSRWTFDCKIMQWNVFETSTFVIPLFLRDCGNVLMDTNFRSDENCRMKAWMKCTWKCKNWACKSWSWLQLKAQFVDQ